MRPYRRKSGRRSAQCLSDPSRKRKLLRGITVLPVHSHQRRGGGQQKRIQFETSLEMGHGFLGLTGFNQGHRDVLLAGGVGWCELQYAVESDQGFARLLSKEKSRTQAVQNLYVVPKRLLYFNPPSITPHHLLPRSPF